VRRAGEQATFRLNAYNSRARRRLGHLAGGGCAVAAGAWCINLGAVRIGSGNVLFNSSQARPAA
jgi:hypothetical protein